MDVAASRHIFCQKCHIISGKCHTIRLCGEILQEEYSSIKIKSQYCIGGLEMNNNNDKHRGFDSFFGFYAGIIYCYSHYGIEDSFPNKIDFHDGVDNWHEEGRYTSQYSHYFHYIHIQIILNIIDESVDKEDPFFLYLGWQGSHYPLQASQEYTALYESNGQQNSRKLFKVKPL